MISSDSDNVDTELGQDFLGHLYVWIRTTRPLLAMAMKECKSRSPVHVSDRIFTDF
jgi:hypothetical protein